MARTATLTAASPRLVLESRALQGVLLTWIVQVLAVAGAGTSQFRGRLADADVADDEGPFLAYEDMSAGAIVAGDTAVAAVGLYRVPADGCDMIVELASGTSVEVIVTPIEEG